jgi:uncharacterized membrane protein YraQ (UPF0718 family)
MNNFLQHLKKFLGDFLKAFVCWLIAFVILGIINSFPHQQNWMLAIIAVFLFPFIYIFIFREHPEKQ